MLARLRSLTFWQSALAVALAVALLFVVGAVFGSASALYSVVSWLLLIVVILVIGVQVVRLFDARGW